MTFGIIGEAGVEAVTMDVVAARAGVSKALTYAYFDNRDQLLAALYEREIGVLERRATRAMQEATTFEGFLRGGVVAWFDVLEKRGAVLSLLVHARLGVIQESRQSVTGLIEAFWAKLIETEFGLGPCESAAASSILVGGLLWLVDMWLAGHAPREDLTETFVRLCVSGLRGLAADAAKAQG